MKNILQRIIGHRRKSQWNKFMSLPIYTQLGIIFRISTTRLFVHKNLFKSRETIKEEWKKRMKSKGYRPKGYGIFQKRLLKRDGDLCQECGEKLIKGVNMTVDHIKPKSKGGTNHLYNLRLLCVKCNTEKADKLLVDNSFDIV